MAILKGLNIKAKADTETGLGTQTGSTGGRFFTSNGKANMEVRGMSFFERLNLFHTLLSLPWWKFLLGILVFFVIVNLFFAGIYLLIGIENLGGMVANSFSEKFGEAFFFSAQTFTTVGYGRINPIGFLSSSVAAIEALLGLMSFALATGLLYGRFSKPRAYIRYSTIALFAPFKGGVAFMIRMVPYTRNYLANIEAKLTLSLKVQEDGEFKTRFFNMPLDISKATTLISNWTLVHPINEESPLYGLKKEDIEAGNAEVLVFLHGFDESFSNTVISRASYTYNQFVYGAKFNMMYHPNKDNSATVLELDKLDDFTKVDLGLTSF